jgi:hypothetical protein
MVGLMLANERLRCCFCGLLPAVEDYVELELHIDKSPATQFLGAHREHLAERLHRSFQIELEPVDPPT